MKKGILVMAYGSPHKPEDIAPFYTDIRRGSPPPPELLNELTERYHAIGGTSPLLEITQHQAYIIGKAASLPAYVGMRHWNPWIHEAVARMKADGIEHAVGIVMAPHFSGMSIAKYIGKVQEANENLNANIKFSFIESWHDEPLYIRALLDRVEEAKKAFSEEEKEDLTVVFTAHSLPEKILKENDPYKVQLLETCALIAGLGDLPEWTFAFQSAGRTQEKWLGPDLLQVMDELNAKGKKAVLVCPVGFVADHLEVLYDIDVEGKAKAEELGMHLERAASLNADERLGEMFLPLIKERFEKQ